MTEIQNELFELQDTAYADFNAKLIPTVPRETVIGVRTPALRSLARELYGTPAAETFLRVLPHRYFDENTLHAHLLGLEKDYAAALAAVERFLPYVDNWAVCDGLSPKVFQRHRAALICEIPRWLASDRTYTVRFGLGVLMQHFLDDDFRPEYLDWAAAVRSEEYYINMMIAWYFATALAKQYAAALPYIERRRLDKWTHNKAIQKGVESRRLTEERKAYLRALRWK